MRKIMSILLVLCAVFSLFPIAGCAAQTAETENRIVISLQIGNPMMTVNGIAAEIDPGRGTSPVIAGERTLVPIRSIIETMGGTVAWEEDMQTALLAYNGDEIRLVMDSLTAYFNEEVYVLDTAPTIIHDRTLLPIRFIAEKFLFSVEWDEAEQKITITKIYGDENLNQPVTPPETEEEGIASFARAVVVYFSATGNTRSLAEKIAESAGADLAEIIPKVPYTSDDLDYSDDQCRANQEIQSEARPEIEEFAVSVSQYDIILLGYPIWWGQCPPAVRTFLDSYDLSGKTIMPFCTSGSTGIDGSLAKIKELAPESTVTQGFRGTATTQEEQIEQWLKDNSYLTQSMVRVRLKSQSGDIIIKLNHNNAAKNFVNQLPLSLDFQDYSQTEKIAYPPEEIDVSDTERGFQPQAGDFAIYAPWGNLALFYRDGEYASSLVPLGSVESGEEWIAELDGAIQAEVE